MTEQMSLEYDGLAIAHNDPAAADDMSRTAILSRCETYRYQLARCWDTTKPLLGWVMLNPSTADALIDDPTIRRCIGFAKAWGYGGIVVVNVYGLRTTDPKRLWQHNDPVGDPENQRALEQLSQLVPLVILAWGANAPEDRARTVAGLLWRAYVAGGARLGVLGWTKAGAPRHPLYVRADTDWTPCDEGQLQ